MEWFLPHNSNGGFQFCCFLLHGKEQMLLAPSLFKKLKLVLQVMLNRVVHPPTSVLNAKEWNHDYVKLSVGKKII